MGKMLPSEAFIDYAEGCLNPHHVHLAVRVNDRPIRMTVSCGSRINTICPACAKQWRNKTRAKYIHMVKEMTAPKFLTITLRYDPNGPSSQRLRVKELWEDRKQLFEDLRKQGYQIGSWVATIEAPNHMHIIMDSDFIPQRVISQLWHKITKDSYIVDIKEVLGYRENLARAAAYITKYLTKLTELSYYESEELKGFHLVHAQTARALQQPRSYVRVTTYYKIDRLTFEGRFYDFYHHDPGDERLAIPPKDELWEGGPQKTLQFGAWC